MQSWIDGLMGHSERPVWKPYTCQKVGLFIDGSALIASVKGAKTAPVCKPCTCKNVVLFIDGSTLTAFVKTVKTVPALHESTKWQPCKHVIPNLVHMKMVIRNSAKTSRIEIAQGQQQPWVCKVDERGLC